MSEASKAKIRCDAARVVVAEAATLDYAAKAAEAATTYMDAAADNAAAYAAALGMNLTLKDVAVTAFKDAYAAHTKAASTASRAARTSYEAALAASHANAESCYTEASNTAYEAALAANAAVIDNEAAAKAALKARKAALKAFPRG